jgi:hypothetical protein
MNCGYRGNLIKETCGNNIGRGEQELLRSRTHNRFVNYTRAIGSNTVITTMCDSLGNHNS